MIIRQANIDDLDGAVELFKEFVQESLGEYGVGINIVHIAKVAKEYVDTTLICEHEGKVVGIVAGEIKLYPLDGRKIYNEIIWFVSNSYRRYGVRLLKELEIKCKEWGCSHIIMAFMENCNAHKLEGFYNKLGYVPLERHLIKQIGG